MPELLNREFFDDIILHHLKNIGRLDDSFEPDLVYGEMRWVVRMWYDIADYILMSFPEEDLHETILEIQAIDEMNKGYIDYDSKMSLNLLEYVEKLNVTGEV
jgi:hypothetical protein